MNTSLNSLTAENDYKPNQNFDSLAYGPVLSRRLGLSLGINLLGNQEKICNFNCPYCDLGFTKIKISQIKKNNWFPKLSSVGDALREKIVELSKSEAKIDHLTISGNGEPTVYPEFPEAITLIRSIRDQMLPGVPIAILTNGSKLGDSQILKSLNLCDVRMVKLDAGNDDMLEKTESPLTRTNLTKLIQGAKALKDVIIQSMFIKGAVDNTLPEHIDDWIEVMGLIKPKLVHIYSMDRAPALAKLNPVPRQRLKEISMLLEKKTKITSLIFS